MRIRSIMFFLCPILMLGCIDNRNNNASSNGHGNVKNQKAESTRFLFDAVNILGKTSPEIEKILGKPYLVTGESKSEPTVKSRWHWYKYETDLSVFFDRDSQNDIATTITLIFSKKPADAIEAAWILGINLNGRTPSISNPVAGLKQYDYLGLEEKGKRFEVHFFKSDKGDDTIKVWRSR